MKYTLRQLEVFLAAARFENLSKASDHLAMSQSAASSALKDLENQFDIQLFDRIGKRLQINELGKMILPRAQSLLTQGGELETLLRKHQEAGDITIGATLTIGNYLCPGLMATYMEQQKDAKVSLEVANTEEIVRKVESYELDIGLVEGEIAADGLDIIPWRDDDLVVCAHPDHPLAAKEALDDQDLLSARWIIRESGSGTRQAFDRAMAGLLPEFTVALELQHTEAIKHAVEANLGVACLSRIVLKDSFARGSLVPLNVPHRDFSRRFYFVLHKQKYLTAGIEQWMALCRS